MATETTKTYPDGSITTRQTNRGWEWTLVGISGKPLTGLEATEQDAERAARKYAADLLEGAEEWSNDDSIIYLSADFLTRLKVNDGINLADPTEHRAQVLEDVITADDDGVWLLHAVTFRLVDYAVDYALQVEFTSRGKHREWAADDDDLVACIPVRAQKKECRVWVPVETHEQYIG